MKHLILVSTVALLAACSSNDTYDVAKADEAIQQNNSVKHSTNLKSRTSQSFYQNKSTELKSQADRSSN
jgi:uncharacterized lipoprotein